MPKKVKVNDESCIGCGLCVSIMPDVFKFTDDGKATADAEIEESALEEAVALCPVGAIE